MKRMILLAALGLVLAAGAAVTLTVMPQSAISGPCDKHGCCSGQC
jgi:hypothetical protein